MRFNSVVLLAMTLLAGCALFDPYDHDDRTYVGHYAWGFEENGFAPCSEQSVWWVVNRDETRAVGDSLFAQYNRVAEAPYEQVYVRLEGRPGPKGQFGHLGAYEREFYLDRIIEIRKAGLGDCNLRD